MTLRIRVYKQRTARRIKSSTTSTQTCASPRTIQTVHHRRRRSDGTIQTTMHTGAHPRGAERVGRRERISLIMVDEFWPGKARQAGKYSRIRNRRSGIPISSCVYQSPNYFPIHPQPRSASMLTTSITSTFSPSIRFPTPSHPGLIRSHVSRGSFNRTGWMMLGAWRCKQGCVCTYILYGMCDSLPPRALSLQVIDKVGKVSFMVFQL